MKRPIITALGILSTMRSFGTVVPYGLTGYVAGLTRMLSGLIVIIIASAINLHRRFSFQYSGKR